MIEKTGNDLLVIASQPQELADGQSALIARVKEKEIEAQTDLSEAEILIDRCQKAHLGIERPKRFKKRAESRLLYLSKMREALESGYVIMPNFPGTTIAVRVKKSKPNNRARFASSEWRAENAVPDVAAEILPTGEGSYVNPTPKIYSEGWTEGEGDKKVDKAIAYATAFEEELALPADFLKPSIIEMTSLAMNRKLFDEIAVIDGVPRSRNAFVNNNSSKGDPLVVGVILDRVNRKRMSFLIAWFVDTATF
jgi:hypothetical protein